MRAQIALGLVLFVAALVGGVAVLNVATSSSGSDHADLELLRQGRFEQDAGRLTRLASSKPNDEVLAEVSLKDFVSLDVAAAEASTRGLRLVGVTGAAYAGGEYHVGHFVLPEGADQAELASAYAAEQSRFVEYELESLNGRLSCEAPIAPRPLSEANTLGQLPDGEFPCAPEHLRPNLEATRADFERLLGDVKERGYPVFAIEVSGPARDVATLLDSPSVRGVFLTDSTGFLPRGVLPETAVEDKEGNSR